MKNFKSFTLAETMLVVVILGIIAILVVPQLIRRQVEVSNRTKLKKAMAAYDYLMNRMILENDLHSNTSLKIWGNNCSNSANYFKISQETSDPCVFKTTDGVWWNIENIQQPMVAFKQDDLDDELAKKTDNTKAFYFVAHYDDQGIIRISDNAYEVQRLSNMPDDEVTDGDKAMAKLFGFIDKQKISGIEGEKICTTKKCEIEHLPKCDVPYDDNNACGYCETCFSCVSANYHYIAVYDENGRMTAQYSDCSNGPESIISDCQYLRVFEYNSSGKRTLYKENCVNNDPESCQSCYADNGGVCESYLKEVEVEFCSDSVCETFIDNYIVYK